MITLSAKQRQTQIDQLRFTTATHEASHLVAHVLQGNLSGSAWISLDQDGRGRLGGAFAPCLKNAIGAEVTAIAGAVGQNMFAVPNRVNDSLNSALSRVGYHLPNPEPLTTGEPFSRTPERLDDQELLDCCYTAAPSPSDMTFIDKPEDINTLVEKAFVLLAGNRDVVLRTRRLLIDQNVVRAVDVHRIAVECWKGRRTFEEQERWLIERFEFVRDHRHRISNQMRIVRILPESMLTLKRRLRLNMAMSTKIKRRIALLRESPELFPLKVDG